jgi:hypothetical protein
MHRVLVSTVAVFTVATISAAAQTPLPGSAAALARPQAPTMKVPERGLGDVAAVRNAPAVSTIQGNALDSVNRVLPNTVIRLRDARSGRIFDTQVTDKSGFFSFQSVDPGSYIVEIVGPDQTILAASELLNVNAREAVSAVVKLPFRIPPLANILGHSKASALVVATAAAASGVLAAQATPAEASPRK